MNPYLGQRIRLGLDLTAKGFSPAVLETAYYELTAGKEDERLILETASFEEIDEFYNPGDEMDEFIMEAIMVKSFPQLRQRMRALARVFNKQLRILTDGQITAEEPIVGKPKKTGMFAVVTVQIPMSDGQKISVLFHAPEGDRSQVGDNDMVIAFRWLLNKRDITHVVSPEGGGEVSLDELSKRIAMLVRKNTEKFQRKQKDLIAQRKELEATDESVKAEETRNHDLMAEKQLAEENRMDADNRIADLKKRIGAAKEKNAELQAEIDRLTMQKAADAGKAKGAADSGELTGGTAGEVKKEKADQELEAMRAKITNDLIGRGFKDVSTGEGAETYYKHDATGIEVDILINPEAERYQITVAIHRNSPSGQKTWQSKTLSGISGKWRQALRSIDAAIDLIRSDEAKRLKAEQADRDKQAEESLNLAQLGAQVVPGIRAQEAEEAGKLWKLKEQGAALPRKNGTPTSKT